MNRRHPNFFGVTASSGLGRKDAFVDQSLTNGNAMRQIYFEHFDRGTADIRSSNKNRPLPAKMGLPLVAARMKKTTYLSGLRVNA
jgi:hypothetical protein